MREEEWKEVIHGSKQDYLVQIKNLLESIKEELRNMNKLLREKS